MDDEKNSINDDGWAWYAGSSDEALTAGPFDTREGALQEARAQGDTDFDGGVHLLEAKWDRAKLSGYFNATEFIEEANIAALDVMGDSGDPLFDISSDQKSDLELVIRLTIDRWQKRHGLTFEPWIFSQQRNGEYVPADQGVAGQ